MNATSTSQTIPSSNVPPSLEAPSTGVFQVHVGGLLDVVSRHLYSQGPEVFVRELLQNAVDAIGMQVAADPDHRGRIDIEVVSGDDGQVTIGVEDNGIGLTWEQALPCLATIGYSSKRNAEAQAKGAIGQFGIGLLSGFMVADRIHVISRSREPGDRGFWWKGGVDGEWTRGEVDAQVDAGTKVYLRMRSDQAERFPAAEIVRLAKKFGRFLPIDVAVHAAGESHSITGEPAPWELAEAGSKSETALLDAGEHLIGTRFFGAFAFSHPETGSQGLVFIEPETVSPGADPGHWLYVRRMLIGEKVRELAPAELPFLRVVMNSESLKVNAAREGLHGEENRLEGIHTEVSAALDRYLERIAEEAPERAAAFVRTQAENLLRAVDENGQFLGLLRRFFPLESSLGSVTVDEVLRRHRKIEYVRDEAEYFKVETRARQEGVCLIRATYRQASQILNAVERTLPADTIQAVHALEFLARFSRPSGVSSEVEQRIIGWIDTELKVENCLGGFSDADDPFEAAALMMDDRESIGRQLGGEFSGELWGKPASLTEKKLLLNRNHRVVERWLTGQCPGEDAVRSWCRVFYQVALLGGKETPTPGEQRRFCKAIEGLESCHPKPEADSHE